MGTHLVFHGEIPADPRYLLSRHDGLQACYMCLLRASVLVKVEQMLVSMQAERPFSCMAVKSLMPSGERLFQVELGIVF